MFYFDFLKMLGKLAKIFFCPVSAFLFKVYDWIL